MRMRFLLSIMTLLIVGSHAAEAANRIKDLTFVRGIRSNQLMGYGLVIGLNGTGDSLRNAPFTEQSIQSMMDRMGVNVRNATTRTKNVAAVIVTAELPPFVGRGSRIDVTVSSLGDATSLSGGSLVLTALQAADGQVYAVAQGAVAVSAISATGKAEKLTQGVPTAGRVPNGAMVEREVISTGVDKSEIILDLHNPDFTTVIRIVDSINNATTAKYRQALARERDTRSIEVRRPDKISLARFMSEIGDLTVTPDAPARIVIDERTGTVVIGQNVQISTVAVTHGNTTVRVTESTAVSQPAPFSKGRTTENPETRIAASQTGGPLAVVKGATLESLVDGLNRMGVKPVGIIAILQAIKSAGALQAELVIQ